MKKLATGSFEVKLIPQTDRTITGLARMTMDKEFSGDLEAISQGQMLSARTGTDNSAGYVAIERVEGKLHGLKGSFILQHNGIMSRGEHRLTVLIVPDSGTDELTGLKGELTIKIVDKKHLYELNYEIPKQQ